MSVTTDLSLATPGSPNFKRPKRCLDLGLGSGLGRESPAQSIESVSPPRSCVSSENSHLAVMVVVGCPRCLMYVMIQDDVDAKCPWCKSKVLLAVVNRSAGAGAENGTVAGVISDRVGAKRVRKS